MLGGSSHLVGLRLWKPIWAGQRIHLAARSDSISALTLLLEVRSSGSTSGIVAREMALDLADEVYSPNLVSHLPGVTNRLADALSRLSDPAHAHEGIPPSLRAAQFHDAPSRPRAWYRTLAMQDKWAARELPRTA